jgi:hypothetical protein
VTTYLSARYLWIETIIPAQIGSGFP